MTDNATRPGPLAGMRVLEIAAVGPVPFCGMVLADMGAEVIRIDRTKPDTPEFEVDQRFECMGRNKSSIAIDLKCAEALDVVRELIAESDVLIEGFRPGVMERLGLDPPSCLSLNPRVVIGRCSGWGETGPLAGSAGHDINYLALSGCLAAMGGSGPPAPPLNLIGDFGGAAMHLLCGVLAGVLVSKTTGQGQVVNTSIAAGATALMPMIYGLYAAGRWSLARGENLLDGGAPYYRTYETSDGCYVAVGALENKFYRALLAGLGLEGRIDPAKQHHRSTWAATTAILAERFREGTRDEWTDRFAGSDACVTPVLDVSEAPGHPQNIATRAFMSVDGVTQPSPGVRFPAAGSGSSTGPPAAGADTVDIMKRLGHSDEHIASLRERGAIVCR